MSLRVLLSEEDGSKEVSPFHRLKDSTDSEVVAKCGRFFIIDLFSILSFPEELLDVYGFPIGVQMLIIEMMARWKIRLSHRAKKDVGKVRLENGIIQGDAFSPLLFVLMIDSLIKIVNKKLGNKVQILYYMDDLKVSTSSIPTAQTVHVTVKKNAQSVGMMINNKKSAIQMNVETPLPETLQEIPRLDEMTFK